MAISAIVDLPLPWGALEARGHHSATLEQNGVHDTRLALTAPRLAEGLEG